MMVKDTGVPTICCGRPMEEINPNTTDASFEKHIPTYVKQGSTIDIQVGEVLHPYIDSHYIEWVILETKKGKKYAKTFSYTEAPKTNFVIDQDDEVSNIYSYCNLHGLWQKKLD